MKYMPIEEFEKMMKEGPHLIFEDLYLGSQVNAKDLSTNGNPMGIDVVLNVATDCQYEKNPSIQYVDIPFNDGYEIPEEQFRACMQALVGTHAQGKKVLVHCAAGISRSPTIVAAYLMGKWVGGNFVLTIDQAVDHIRIIRNIVNPHPRILTSAKRYLNVWPYNDPLFLRKS
jgi:protein-tyrosine phosphatase